MISFRSKDKRKTGRRPVKSGRLPMTYYRSQPPSEEKNSPFEKRLTKKSFRYTGLLSKTADIILVAAILFLLLYSLIVRPGAAVVINNTDYHPAADYQKAVRVQLSEFKNRTKITFDEQTVINDLRQKYPEIAQANVDLPFFGQKPKLRLFISPPAFFLTNQSNIYVVDQAGTAVGMAAELPQIKNLPTVNDQSGFKVEASKQVLSSDEVGFIDTVIAQCQRAKVPISQITLPAKAQEVDFKAADRPYYVKFYLGGDPDLQTGQFLAARRQFDASNQQPSEYLDVRVSGKIYFK